ncbi:MAG: hypothetical protein QOG19_2865 [Mycobacterium sp.]|jgi:hypothetical protein|nr:hypothetical protein [Mycobacterium sp.]
MARLPLTPADAVLLAMIQPTDELVDAVEQMMLDAEIGVWDAELKPRAVLPTE